MKRKKYTILCLILVLILLTSCDDKREKGEPDVISSVKMNLDETIIVVANRDRIKDKEEFANLLIQKCKDNSFQSFKFSTDNGYATSLNIRVYLWKDQIEEQEPVMVVEYVPVERGKGYDIIHEPEKFNIYIDGEPIDDH